MLQAEYEDNLTEDELYKVDKIRESYRSDLKSFCEERLQITDRSNPAGAAIIPFFFNHAQLALHETIHKIEQFNLKYTAMLKELDPNVPISSLPIDMVILKARKVGCSTYLAARAFWQAEYMRGYSALTMAHKEKPAQNLGNIHRRFYYQFQDSTPSIRQRIKRKAPELMEWYPDHDSRIIIKTAGAKHGDSRSYTYNFVHISEEAHFVDSDEVATAMAARGDYSECYEESTANGEGNMFHDAWENAMWIEDALQMLDRGEQLPVSWNHKFRFFWPWMNDPDYRLPLLPGEQKYIEETITDKELELMEDHQVSFEQLKWRRHKIRKDCSGQALMAPEDYFCQEYPSTPEEAFVAKGLTVFSQKVLSKMRAEAAEFPRKFYRTHRNKECDFEFHYVSNEMSANLWVFDEPQPASHYIIGVDTAEGLEHGDNSVITVFDRLDGMRMREAARYIGKADAEELGELAVFLAERYNKAYIIPERNAPGNAACIKIVKLGYPFVYHHVDPEKVTDKSLPETFTAGFRTNKHTKGLLVGKGVTIMRDGIITLLHPQAIKEWKIYQNNDGKFGAPHGQCDDCVMADLLAVHAQFTDGVAPMIDFNPERIDPEDDDETPVTDEEVWKEILKRDRERQNKKNIREERMRGKKRQKQARWTINPFG